MYLIFRCRKCGRFLCIDDKIGVKKCPTCGWVNKLGNLKIVGVTNDAREAGEIIRRLQGDGTTFIRADEYTSQN